MWIKHFPLLWIRLQLTDRKLIGFPIPIFVIQEIMDCFLDLLLLISIVHPKKSTSSPSVISVPALRNLIQALMRLFDSVTDSGPYELVGIRTDKVTITIRVL